jgi:membrane-bound lytic murein transglycosylase F
LVAAIVYKESHFNPTIIGLGGAYGLFQFMPQTGAVYGVYPSSSVEEQVEGGIRLILGNYSLFNGVTDHEERVKFALAAYNSGASHVHDARALAQKYHLNPNKWTNHVEVMYRNLSNPEYYNDPVVKYGSSRGVQTVGYVYTVYNLYSNYKNTAK